MDGLGGRRAEPESSSSGRSTVAYDTIILGLGTFGTAAAAELASRGKKVLGLEQYSIPHNFGSHHGHTRAFRTAYFEHPSYVPLLRHAHRRWIELDRKRGGGLFFQTGALYAGQKNSTLIEGVQQSAKVHRLDVQRLLPKEVTQRFPQFRMPEGFEAIWETAAGFIVPELAVSMFARDALTRSAEFHGHEQALEWSSDGTKVQVRTAVATYEAASLVIAGGAWSQGLLPSLQVPLKVTRQALAWYWPKRPAQFGMPAFPVWGVEDEKGDFYYGFPVQPAPPGIKIALHRQGPVTDPNVTERKVLPEDERDTRAALRRFFPDAEGPLLSIATCLYTNSPDGHPVIDLHPAHKNVAFIAGCSGHGFKFAPVFGEILADLVTGGKTAHPAGFLGLSRFA